MMVPPGLQKGRNEITSLKGICKLKYAMQRYLHQRLSQSSPRYHRPCIVSPVCLFPPQHCALQMCPPSTAPVEIMNAYIQRVPGAPGLMLTRVCACVCDHISVITPHSKMERLKHRVYHQLCLWFLFLPMAQLSAVPYIVGVCMCMCVLGCLCCVYVCLVWGSVLVCAFVFECVLVFVCLVCMSRYVYVCVYVCIWVCWYVCVLVCMAHGYMLVCLYIYV